MKVLVCAETRNGEIERVSLEMLSAARVAAGDGEVVALVVGNRADNAEAQLGSADRVIAAIDPALAVPTAEVYARIALGVMQAEKPDLTLVGYTATGLDVGPELSARAHLPLVAYVVGLESSEGGLVALSQIYGGKLVAEVPVRLPAMLMVNPGAFAEVPESAIDPARIASLDARSALGAARVKLVEEVAPDIAEVDLGSAERIVCVGRGIGDRESIELARDLAALLGAEIAGSRPVVDNGWLPKPRQVGKSGQKVKPKLYLALGVSGAPEHLEGMSRSDLIIAINTDPTAPIFNVAHYGATCDLFDLIASLSEQLREARAA